MLGELVKRIVEPELHPWRCPGCDYDAQREKCPECGVTREQYVAVLRRERPWRIATVIALVPGVSATLFFLGLAILYSNDMAFLFCLLYAAFCGVGAIAGTAVFAYMRQSRPKKHRTRWKCVGILIAATIGSIVPVSLIIVQLVVIG